MNAYDDGFARAQTVTRPMAEHGKWPCGGDFCTGRKFGGWADCLHGARGYLAELDDERWRVIERINTARVGYVRAVDGPPAIELVRELMAALHGESWAKAESPQMAWESLLDEVRELVRLKAKAP